MRRTIVLTVACGLFISGAVVAGDAATDNSAKAKKDREDGLKLWRKANLDHEKAVKDADAAEQLTLASATDQYRACDLFWEAFKLDPKNNKDCRKEWLEVKIHDHEVYATYLDNGIKAIHQRLKVMQSKIESETRSMKDLDAAIASEKDAGSKAVEQSVESNDKEDLKISQQKLADDQDGQKRWEAASKSHHDAIKRLQDELKKLG